MAIDITVGGHTVLTRAVAVLRAGFDAARSSANTELGNVSIPAALPDDGAILAGDRRNPPQARTWILLAETLESETSGGARESRSIYRLTVTVGVRHTTRGGAEAGDNSQSGAAICAALMSTVRHVLRRDMCKASGLYGLAPVQGSERNLTGIKGTFAKEAVFRVYVRTRNPWGEATP